MNKIEILVKKIITKYKQYGRDIILQSPATEEMISTIESKMGGRFDENFRSFYKITNGSNNILGAYHPPDSPTILNRLYLMPLDYNYDFLDLYPSGIEYFNRPNHKIWKSTKEIDPSMITKNKWYPFGCNHHSYYKIFYDFSPSKYGKNGQIIAIDIENTYYISDNFLSFYEGCVNLFLDKYEELGLMPAQEESLNDTLDNEIIRLLKEGKTEEIENMIITGVFNWDLIGKERRSLYECAIIYNQENFGNILIKKYDYDKGDAFIECLRNLKFEFAKRILDNGLDINQKFSTYYDAPLISRVIGQASVMDIELNGVRMLIEAGADLNIVDNNKNYPLDYARLLYSKNQEISRKITRLLVKSGATKGYAFDP